MEEVRTRPREDWRDDSYVEFWLDRDQGARHEERLRQFAMIRSYLPRERDEAFRYVDIGAGDGRLDEMLLGQFEGAQATLVDGSPLMGERARERLRAFGDRVTVVQADLASPGWQRTMDPPYDIAVSTIAIHNLRDPDRIRELYAEVYQLLAPGGFFMNLDYVRPTNPELRALLSWARGDSNAGRAGGGTPTAGMDDQLQWLRDAGFGPVDCFWREFQAALFGGFKAPVRIPGAA